MKGSGDDGNAAGDRGVVEQLHTMFRGDGGKSGAAIGDELLVGSDDGLARAQRCREPALDRIEATDGLDDDIDVCSGEHGLRLVVPLRRGGHMQCGLRAALAGDVAVDDVGQLDAFKLLRGKQAGDGGADGAEAEQGDARGVRAERRVLGAISHGRVDVDAC